MSDKTKQQLKIENNSSFPNNNTGFITPDKLRTFNENVIDSFLVNDYTASNDATIADLSGSFNDFTQSYYVDSASFDSRISAVDTSSYVQQTEFDTFETQSNQRLDSLEQFTASIDDDFVSEAELAAATGALENEIATKADQTDFTAYTSSNDSRVSGIENTTASLETKFDTLATTTSSLQDFTASADSRLTNIESNTASYARTDTTNQFQQTQTLEQDLVVQGNLYVSGAEVIISSSELIVGDRIIEVNANKVIGDAGLYAFDAIGDQTGSFIWNPNLDYWLAGLSGSEEKVLVSSDTASIETSLNALNDLSGSLLQTASNDFSEITLTKVDGSTQVLDTTPRQVIESVKNGNGQQLPKGTPVYASGSVGNAQLVFPASASDDTTMPAVYILAQTLDPDEEGLGYTHGFINGVNTSLFNAGDEIYVGVNGGYTNQAPTGSTNLIQKLGTVVRSDVSNGSGVIQIDSIRALPNIQEGYLWVGDSDGVPQQIATSSIEENTDLSSLNSFTQSQEDLNGTFATTGSNTFTDNQVVSGSITISEGNDLNFGYNTNGMVLTSYDDLETVSAFDTSFGIINRGFDLNQSPVQRTIAIGAFSLGGQQAQSGSLIDQTLALGHQALTRFEAGELNTAIGGNVAMAYLSNGSRNTAIGGFALQALGFGTGTESHERNTGIGSSAGNTAAAGGFFTGGNNNTFIGANSAPLNTNTNYETVIGAFAQGHGEATTTIGTVNQTQGTYILGDTFISSSGVSGGDLDIQGNIKHTLTEGTVLVGDSNNRTYEVSTGSFGGGSTDISSLNAFTASQEDLNSTFATTGSNTFDGTQTINGNLEFGSFADIIGQNFAFTAQTNMDFNGNVSASYPVEFGNFSSADFNVAQVNASGSLDVGNGASITGSLDIPSGSRIVFRGGGSATSSFEYGQFNQFNIRSNSLLFNSDGFADFVAASQFLFAADPGNTDGNIVFDSRYDGNNTGSLGYMRFKDYSSVVFDGNARNTSTSSPIIITGSVNISETMNLASQDPLPSGNIGDLAVSGSELFFYNGSWTQIS